MYKYTLENCISMSGKPGNLRENDNSFLVGTIHGYSIDIEKSNRVQRSRQLPIQFFGF